MSILRWIPGLLYWSYDETRAPSCYPDNKFHGANMGPTWVMSAPDGLHVVPMNLAIRVHDVWCYFRCRFRDTGYPGQNSVCTICDDNIHHSWHFKENITPDIKIIEVYITYKLSFIHLLVYILSIQLSTYMIFLCYNHKVYATSICKSTYVFTLSCISYLFTY